MIEIRRYQPGDEAALLAVYRSAIRMIASKDYTQAQIEAWAYDEIDPASWVTRVQGINPFVAIDQHEIVGYADVQPSGYIDHFFVSGFHPRRGIGARLMERILAEASIMKLRELTSHVSRTAEPFFAHYGFVAVERREPVVRGVAMANALMRKALPNRF